jgi:hypothetical protein
MRIVREAAVNARLSAEGAVAARVRAVPAGGRHTVGDLRLEPDSHQVWAAVLPYS